MAKKSPLFCFFSLSAVYPRFATLLSVEFLFFRSRLLHYCRRLSTMMPASFASKPDLSLPSGLEGLRRNIAAIGSTPPPPAAGSSLGRASVLSQCVVEGLSSNFSGQSSGKWSVLLSHFMTVTNACGLRFWGAGTTAMAPQLLTHD